MSHSAVILLQMGGPSDLDDVKRFLLAMFSDRDMIALPFRSVLAPLIANLRAPTAKRRYARIHGGSPLPAITAEQANRLEEQLNAGQPRRYRVTFAMRYVRPSVIDVIKSPEIKDADRIFALSMYPQYCQATIGSSLKELKRVYEREEALPPLRIIDRYFEHPAYLEALADSVTQVLDRASGDPFVLFSAHGVPEKIVRDGDPYVEETRITAAGVAKRLGLAEDCWQLSFQSRLGPIRWVAPHTEDVLRSLPRRGVEQLVLVPISFTAENLETLYDMDIVFTALARRVGIEQVLRVPALNASPSFIRALASLVQSV